MTIPFPPYRPTSWELQLPNYRVITNSWRSTEIPEILGSLPEDARLRLRYENITNQQALELLLLWRATAGGYYPLDPLPAEVAAGINDAALANRIRSIAPLSWVVADPPRQESIKNLRSGVDIELKSELRFVPSIATPTVTCPIYVVREYSGCIGGGVEPEPEPVVAPDMWVSRLDDNTSTELLPSSACMCSDGFSYQVSYVQFEANPDVVTTLIVLRNQAGEVQWQREISNLFTVSFVGEVLADYWHLEVGSSDELFIFAVNGLYQQDDADAGGSGGFTDNPANFSARGFCVNRSGSLVWQKKYSTTTGRRIGVTSILYNPILDQLLVFMATNAAGGESATGLDPTIGIFAVAATTGNLAASRIMRVASLALNNMNYIQSWSGVLRNNRLYCFGSFVQSAFVFAAWPVIVEVSLDLGTVFNSIHYSERWLHQLMPHPDGGWIFLAEQSISGISRYQAYKVNSGFSPIWRQTGTSQGLIVSQSRMRHRATPVSGNYVYSSSNARAGSVFDAWTVVPAVKNWDAVTFGPVVTSAIYDHSLSRAGVAAASIRPLFYNVRARDHTSGHANNFYCQATDSITGSLGNESARAQRGRVVAFGHRLALPDEGERSLDVGLGLNSNFFAVLRGQVDGQFNPATESTNVLDLPTPVTFTPQTLSSTVSALDTSFSFATSSYSFAYYSYSDPAFTTPAAEGDAGFGFYTGNNAVQQVNVGHAFTPSLVFHASRNNAGPLANPGIKHLFSGQAGWDRFCRTDSTNPHGTTPNGVLEAGTGYFKISGRKNVTAQNWNELSVEYAVLALGLLVGGHAAVTYTGNGASSQSVAHGLGVTPDLVFLFPHVDNASLVAGSSFLPAGQSLLLNSTAAAAANSNRVQSISSSAVTVGGTEFGLPNISGAVWTMHSFASSDAWDIGVYQGNGVDVFVQTLGYQPKAVIVKNVSGGTSSWFWYFRPDDTAGVAQFILLNSTNAESTSGSFSITADGFTVNPGSGIGNSGTTTALYFAIR